MSLQLGPVPGAVWTARGLVPLVKAHAAKGEHLTRRPCSPTLFPLRASLN
jgi:hypothetical protein